jgi:aspartate/methionine/tyrosine aminotransferase
MALATSSIRLSQRAAHLKPSATLAVSARVKELRAAGRDVIGFGAGEPDFDTPDSIKDVAIESLRGGRTGYQPVPGIPEARAAIARKLVEENGINCTADDIVINAGAKHSVYLTLQALVDPGDDVIVPTPAWVSYRPMIELAGGGVVEVPGAVDNDFKITPAQLAEAITPKTVAVIINSPSNPCGTMYTPEELRALAEVLGPHEHVAVISDEIYEKLIFGGIEHFSLGALPVLADRVITVNGLSKAFAMTGWRLGYVCAPGGVAKAISKLQGQMTSHPTAFCLPAIEEAITRCGADVERMRTAFAERAELIHGLLSAMPGVICPRPTGAFYVFPHVGAHFGKTSPAGRTIDSAIAFAESLLEEGMVGVVPGDDFGECAREHIRMSFAASVEQIEEGCRRLAAWLDSLS